MKVTISEARLNDMAYMALRRYYFDTAGSAPRECDIRIVMDMAVPSRIKSPLQAILSPSEHAGRSHDTTYEVDTDQVLTAAMAYLEDHWKVRFPIGEKDNIKSDWERCVPVLLQVPEQDCGG